MARQLDEQIAARFRPGRPLRVLDVGTGRGAQALRLARAGHEVTGLEQDPARLSVARAALAAEPREVRERTRFVEGDGRDTGVHFLPGSFDVVLCHGLLRYVAQADPVVAGLARMLGRGGLVSLLVGNADAMAMRPGLSGDWAGALGAFGSVVGRDRHGVAVRGDRLGALTATLAGIGAPLRAWYGVRVFTDAADLSAGAGAGGGGPQDLALLLDAEERAGRTDPYRGVASLLHLCGVRG
ncbi:class I SAM-dependent methyltransferase [Streptomyces sp. JNUCC 64]